MKSCSFGLATSTGDDSSLPSKLAPVSRLREDTAVSFRKFNARHGGGKSQVHRARISLADQSTGMGRYHASILSWEPPRYGAFSISRRMFTPFTCISSTFRFSIISSCCPTPSVTGFSCRRPYRTPSPRHPNPTRRVGRIRSRQCRDGSPGLLRSSIALPGSTHTTVIFWNMRIMK